MEKANIPEDETQRVASLLDLEILDTEIEDSYDKITKLAARICDVPICLISLIDSKRQWFKSRYGLEASETSRDYAFCAHAILGDKLFEVKNALEDERFFDNPLVLADPKVIFYTGAVLKTFDKHNLGTLCVIDHVPKELNDFQKEALEILAKQVVTMLELRRSIKNFSKANKNQTSFFASISHELRTPLSGIIGVLELLKDTKLDREQREYVRTVQECGNNLVTIINDILDISKIQVGKLELAKQSFDLTEATKLVVNLFHPESVKKKIKLTLNIENNIPEKIIGDETRYKQILINLISNALKFTLKGEVKVDLLLKDSTEFDYTIGINISDTGIGIPLKDQEKIFSDFSQANESITRKFGGTGLGLSICKKLSQLMKGDISVVSEENKGSIFTVHLHFDK